MEKLKKIYRLMVLVAASILLSCEPLEDKTTSFYLSGYWALDSGYSSGHLNKLVTVVLRFEHGVLTAYSMNPECEMQGYNNELINCHPVSSCQWTYTFLGADDSVQYDDLLTLDDGSLFDVVDYMGNLRISVHNEDNKNAWLEGEYYRTPTRF